MYIDKNDTSFIVYLIRKYQIGFDSIDDYLFWLYRSFSNSNKIKYYQTLEEDIILYSNIQTGKEDKDGALE